MIQITNYRPGRLSLSFCFSNLQRQDRKEDFTSCTKADRSCNIVLLIQEYGQIMTRIEHMAAAVQLLKEKAVTARSCSDAFNVSLA